MSLKLLRRRIHSKLGKPFGYSTRKPPIIKLDVHLQTANRQVIQKRIKTHVTFTKILRQIVITITNFPKALQTISQATNIYAIKTHIRTKTQFIKTFGYITRNPSIRPLIVKSQAISRSKMKPRIKTYSFFTYTFGGISDFVSYGASFLFTAANWATITVYLETYMRAVSGTVNARLLDETTGLPVTNSQISSSNAIFERIRSIALTLIDTHTYRLQLGTSGSSDGEILSDKLIIINK